MIDSQFPCFVHEEFKQIDDIIDARKKLGQYNVFTQGSNNINYRYAYSSSTSERYVRFDDTVINDEYLLNNGMGNLKQTDSEITIVRVRCKGLSKRRLSKWDMHDEAIPGDGSHLGESPSLVNLATLVAQTNQNMPAEGSEYLVPLSSWDPYYKNEELRIENWTTINNNEPNVTIFENTGANYCGDDIIPMMNNLVGNSGSVFQLSPIARRPSFAGRISKFLRKHCKKPKSLPETLKKK